MRITRYASALLALALPFVACGTDDRPIQPLGQSNAITAETAPINPPSTSVVTVEPTPQPTVTTTEPAPPTTEAPVARPARTVPVPPEVVRTPAVESGGLACGGSLPPCWVMQRESGGDPTIYNAQGSGASGKWQFMPGTWRTDDTNGDGRADSFRGYANAAEAPVSVQDERARQVWAGGAGCSHWSAC